MNTDVAAAIQQTNEATASAAATAESIIEQTLVQSGGNQVALQQASVAQLVTAQAVAGLVDVDNISVGIGARVTQTNRAAAQVTAAAGAEITQMLSQEQSGASGMHTQVALQSASIAQQLSAGAVATVTHSSNSDVSVDGSSAQSATSSATATGVELAGTRQVAEQEQQGDQSDQEQLAGQWADTAQQLELLAGAGVTEARISSRLNGDSAKLDIGAAAVSTGTSLSTIQQLALQFQSGDEVAQQQESYQIASVEQSGIALAAATAGGTLHYVLVPVALRAVEQASLPEEMLLAQALPTSIEPSFVPVTAARGVAAKRSAAKPSPRPILTPVRPTIFVRKQAAAPAAPLAVPLSNDSASTAGSAGTAPKRAKDAEQAPDRTPRGQCLAPCSGASAASAGTGSGSAFVASSGYALSPVPRLGRRQSAPAGRRPAAVVLLRAKPG